MGGPNVRGGNDPARSAILSRIRQTGGSNGPPQAQAVPPQAAPGEAGQSNEVAFHLARAFEALSRTGPTDENLAALEGFLSQLQTLKPPEVGAIQAPTRQASIPGPPPIAGGQTQAMPLG